MKILGVEFDVEVDWDRDGRIDTMQVFVKDSDQELSGVLNDKVLTMIEEELYKSHEGPEEDPRQDR